MVGRNTLDGEGARRDGGIPKIEAARIGPSLIEGDTTAMRWKFTFTRADGSVRMLDEIAWQTWCGEQLIEEHFFYDPRQMAG